MPVCMHGNIGYIPTSLRHHLICYITNTITSEEISALFKRCPCRDRTEWSSSYHFLRKESPAGIGWYKAVPTISSERKAYLEKVRNVEKWDKSPRVIHEVLYIYIYILSKSCISNMTANEPAVQKATNYINIHWFFWMCGWESVLHSVQHGNMVCRRTQVCMTWIFVLVGNIAS